MQRHERSAPIWLFSFVDLAFLLLIAFTQIGGGDVRSNGPVVQVELASLHDSTAQAAGNTPTARWRLQVAAASERGESTPFLLLEPDATAGAPSAAIGASDLSAHLRILGDRGLDRPVLLPHPEARAEDLLVAVDLVDDVWHRSGVAWARPRPADESGTRLVAPTPDVAAP